MRRLVLPKTPLQFALITAKSTLPLPLYVLSYINKNKFNLWLPIRIFHSSKKKEKLRSQTPPLHGNMALDYNNFPFFKPSSFSNSTTVTSPPPSQFLLPISSLPWLLVFPITTTYIAPNHLTPISRAFNPMQIPSLSQRTPTVQINLGPLPPHLSLSMRVVPPLVVILTFLTSIRKLFFFLTVVLLSVLPHSTFSPSSEAPSPPPPPFPLTLRYPPPLLLLCFHLTILAY